MNSRAVLLGPGPGWQTGLRGSMTTPREGCRGSAEPGHGWSAVGGSTGTVGPGRTAEAGFHSPGTARLREDLGAARGDPDHCKTRGRAVRQPPERGWAPGGLGHRNLRRHESKADIRPFAHVGSATLRRVGTS